MIRPTPKEEVIYWYRRELSAWGHSIRVRRSRENLKAGMRVVFCGVAYAALVIWLLATVPQ